MPPPSCPACSAELTHQTGQCAACGVVLGEDNRCARCLAVAAVFERTGRYVCSACGETRQRHARTVVTSEAALLQAFEARVPRPIRSIALTLTIVVALVLGYRAGLSRGLLWLGLIVGTITTLQLARSVIGTRQHARARRRYEIEQRIIGLAFCNDGLLSAALVSDTLRISVLEAQALLGELVVAGRARAEQSVDGPEIIYHFSEAKRTRGIRRSQLS